MDRGLHVLSEIPTVNSIEEAKMLKNAVKSHPELKYMTGENCCYWAFIQAWKNMYDEGKLGTAVYAEAEYIHGSDIREKTQADYDPNHWRYFNPAIKYLTHDLGPLLYIMDDQCVSVSCMQPDELYNPYRPDKNGIAIFKTKKGAVIALLLGSVVMPLVAALVNYFVMLPLYMSAASHSVKLNLVITTITPFNFVRAIVLSFITVFCYKRLSSILHK